MDFLFELLFDLIAEGTVELSKSRKVPKCIRYPLIAIIVLFFACIIAVLLIVGVTSLDESPVLAAILIISALFMLIAGIIKFRKTYLTRNNDLKTNSYQDGR